MNSEVNSSQSVTADEAPSSAFDGTGTSVSINDEVVVSGDAFVSPVDSENESCLSVDDNSSVGSGTPMLSQTMRVESVEMPNRPPGDSAPSTLSFHGITYEVSEKLNDVPFCGEWGKKEILRGVRSDIHAFCYESTLTRHLNFIAVAGYLPDSMQ